MSSSMKSGVYKIKNLLDGLVYIGSAIKCVERRKREHYRHLRKNKHQNYKLQEAWNRDGERNFEFSVIEYCEPDRALEQEQFWLDCFCSYDNRFGYNIRQKTDNGWGMIYTDEIKTKLRDGSLKAWEDLETRQKYLTASESYWLNEEAHKRHSEIMKEVMNRPEVKEKFQKAMNTPEIRVRRSEITSSSWRHPEQRTKRITGLQTAWDNEEKKTKRVEKGRKTRANGCGQKKKEFEDQALALIRQYPKWSIRQYAQTLDCSKYALKKNEIISKALLER